MNEADSRKTFCMYNIPCKDLSNFENFVGVRHVNEEMEQTGALIKNPALTTLAVGGYAERGATIVGGHYSAIDVHGYPIKHSSRVTPPVRSDKTSLSCGIRDTLGIQ